MEWFAAPALTPPALLPDGFQVVQNVGQVRFASAGYITGPLTEPANRVFPPRLYGDIAISQSGVDALGIGGRIALGVAEFEVWNADNALDQMVDWGTADGRAATIRIAPVLDQQASDFGTPWQDTAIVYRGVVQRVDRAANQRARITITDASERLAVPLQNERFTGAGGLEGPATLAGRPKPIAIGALYNEAPVALGNVDLGDGALPTYAVHWRAINGITAVRIRGVLQSYLPPFSGPPGVGEYTVFEDYGVFQLGSTADGIVSCGIQGDAVGGYVYSTSGVIRRLLQAMGPRLLDADLQIDSFDIAETDLPGAIGFFQGAEETTTEAAIDRILAGCGAVLCGGRDGTVRLVDPLAEGTVQFGIAAGSIIDLEPVALPAALRPLPRAVAVDWRHNGAPLTDIAGIVGDSDRAALQGSVGGPARAQSTIIAGRVGQQRDMRLPGLYYAEADAMVRAERFRAFFEAGPRMFRFTTDRYLGQIEVGDLGTIAYPAFGLHNGAGVVVLDWSEQIASRRMTLTVVTAPWLTVPPIVSFAGVGLGDFILDVSAVL